MERISLRTHGYCETPIISCGSAESGGLENKQEVGQRDLGLLGSSVSLGSLARGRMSSNVSVGVSIGNDAGSQKIQLEFHENRCTNTHQ